MGEKAFQFSPAEWLSIHRRLFEGVFRHAGQILQYNITKKEWVLNGDTVIYADWNSIKDTLDYDFANEKQFSYEGLSVDAAVKHLAKFASDIWQIHPFGEGNTRATAVFMIKYMKTFGFRVNNDAFEKTRGTSATPWSERTIRICKRAFTPPQSSWRCFSAISFWARITN